MLVNYSFKKDELEVKLNFKVINEEKFLEYTKENKTNKDKLKIEDIVALFQQNFIDLPEALTKEIIFKENKFKITSLNLRWYLKYLRNIDNKSFLEGLIKDELTIEDIIKLFQNNLIIGLPETPEKKDFTNPVLKVYKKEGSNRTVMTFEGEKCEIVSHETFEVNTEIIFREKKFKIWTQGLEYYLRHNNKSFLERVIEGKLEIRDIITCLKEKLTSLEKTLFKDNEFPIGYSEEYYNNIDNQIKLEKLIKDEHKIEDIIEFFKKKLLVFLRI